MRASPKAGARRLHVERVREALLVVEVDEQNAEEVFLCERACEVESCSGLALPTLLVRYHDGARHAGDASTYEWAMLARWQC